MTKTSMASLSEKLQRQMAEDQRAVNDQTQKLLGKHADALSQLSIAALSTTKGVMGKQTAVLQGSLSTYSQEIDKLQEKTLQRLGWLMLWPLVSAVILSVSMIVGAWAWSWWEVGQARKTAQAQIAQARLKVEQQSQLIAQLNTQFCASPAGRGQCK